MNAGRQREALHAALARGLASWDGRSRADIEALYQRAHADPGLAPALCRLLDDGAQTVGATWLLKRALEAGAIEPGEVERSILGALGRLQAPEAALHVLQILDRLYIAPARKTAVRRFVFACFESPNKFVSAWAYSGLHALASAFPAYRAEALEIMEMGLRDGPASTRARIRQLQKRGFPE